jgi:DNA-binding CsgD family transcriptional regulator
MSYPDARPTAISGIAAFTSGPGGALTAWNDSAERLLQFQAGDVLGRSCHEVVTGHDPFGNLYCGPDCPIRQMARNRLPIAPFRLDVVDAAGDQLPLRISIAVVEEWPDQGPSLLHFLEPAFGRSAPSLGDRAPSGPPPAPTPRIGRLTAREAEVLQMIATGTATADCALALGISTVTVRNHVQSCLRKLNAHNRLEAVRRAERLGLLDALRLR